MIQKNINQVLNQAVNQAKLDTFAGATANLVEAIVAQSLSDISEGVLKLYQNEEGPISEVYLNFYTLLDNKVKELRGETDDDDDFDNVEPVDDDGI